MEKVTKKKQIEDLQTVVAAQWRQINKLKLHLGRLVDIDWSDEQDNHDEVVAILDNKEPKLKVLSQSVFDGLDAKWRFASVDKDSRVFAFNGEPEVRNYVFGFSEELGGASDYLALGAGYDTTNWQNSLVERDKVELTGSDLCRKMLERGDKAVLCLVIDNKETGVKRYDAITKTSGRSAFLSHYAYHHNAIPVNNQGEPLTATDVGL